MPWEPDIRDRSFHRLDWQMLSKRGCPDCGAGPGMPHTYVCANRRVKEAIHGKSPS